MGDDQIGYVHLRAMGSSNINQWYREFYPVFNKKGLIVDVRHNNGGNIDSFILEKLMRKAWMYCNTRSSDRSGSPPLMPTPEKPKLSTKSQYSSGS